ncbi:MAG: Holliday junction branch migration protein RuvA [Candidatus Omnitrophota bacterium]
MISGITGKIIERNSNCLVLETGNFCYEVLIPPTVMQRLDEGINKNDMISLITFHYYQVEPSKSSPVLIGFLNAVERDFFEVFITVSGIGPRAAVKALNKPISEIAKAIDDQDISFLKSLPGIGEQRAREIVAKLQNKVGKFGLIQDTATKKIDAKRSDIAQEALSVLMQLEYKKSEASVMIKKALESSSNIQTTEDLLNVVYKQKKVG